MSMFDICGKNAPSCERVASLACSGGSILFFNSALSPAASPRASILSASISACLFLSLSHFSGVPSFVAFPPLSLPPRQTPRLPASPKALEVLSEKTSKSRLSFWRASLAPELLFRLRRRHRSRQSGVVLPQSCARACIDTLHMDSLGKPAVTEAVRGSVVGTCLLTQVSWRLSLRDSRPRRPSQGSGADGKRKLYGGGAPLHR